MFYETKNQGLKTPILPIICRKPGVKRRLSIRRAAEISMTIKLDNVTLRFLNELRSPVCQTHFMPHKTRCCMHNTASSSSGDLTWGLVYYSPAQGRRQITARKASLYGFTRDYAVLSSRSNAAQK